MEWVEITIKFFLHLKSDLVFHISRLCSYLEKRILEYIIFGKEIDHVLLETLNVDIDFIQHKKMYSFFLHRLCPHLFYASGVVSLDIGLVFFVVVDLLQASNFVHAKLCKKA